MTPGTTKVEVRPRLATPVQAGTFRITSGFGPRSDGMHRGIDFASIVPGKNYAGADIYAMEDAVVVEGSERLNVSGFGGWVWLRHVIGGQTVDTIYGHMYQRDILVKKGDKVQRGHLIAKVGGNGGVPPHLHAEVWIGGAAPRVTGAAVDLAGWLTTA